MDNPFLYAAWRRLRRRPWALLLLFAGPLLAWTPMALRQFAPFTFSEEDAVIGGLQILVTYLCVRAVSATVGSLSQERERCSWDVLLSSGVSPARIGWGLWLAAMGPCLTETVLAAGCVFLTLGSAAGAFAALCLVLVLFYANWGLYCSLRFPSLAAAQFGYGWLGVCAVTGFFTWICGEMNVSTPWEGLVYVINPWWVLARALVEDKTRYGALAGILVYAVLAVGVFVLLARGVTGNPPRHGVRRTLTRHAAEDPLAYRQRRTSGPALGAYALLLIGSAAFWSKNADAMMFLTLTAHVGFWLVRVLHTSTAMLCREREGRTLDALLTTRLTPAELCSGLWRQSVQPIMREALWLSPLLLLIVGARPLLWAYLTAITLASIAGWGGLALAVSMRSRTTLAAFQAAYLCLALFLMGTLIVDVCLLDHITSAYNGPVLALANPLVACLAGVENSRQDWQYFSGPACLAAHALAGWAGMRFVRRRLALRR